MLAKRRAVGLSLGLATLMIGPDVAPASDPLSSVRHEVRTEQPREPRPPSEPKRRSATSDEDDDGFSDDGTLLLAGLFGVGIVAASPWWIPMTLVEDRHPGPAYFAAAPYVDAPGAMVYDPEEPAFNWASRLGCEYLDDFEGVTAYRGRLVVEHVNRWGIDSEWNYWRESLSPGVHDQLWTGDANIVYRFAQNERVLMRSGLGVAWLADNEEVNLGFNFTYGADIYPIEPLVFTADLDAGWIGEAWMLHLRATAGLVYRQAEVYAGYDYLEIGNAQLNGVVAGLRILF
jgi:hypothetical protein